MCNFHRTLGFALLAMILCLHGSFTPSLFAQELSGSEGMPPKDSGTGQALRPGSGQAQDGSASGMSPKDLPVASPREGAPAAVPGVLPAASDGFPEMSPTSLGMIVLALLIGGLVLLFIEVALIPGFGLTGITGIIVILAGLGLAFWKLDLKIAVAYTLVSFIALVAVVFWSIYVFPYTTLGKKFRLETRISVEDGYTAIRDMSRYVGLEGIATSDLRPSGIARVGEDRLDVISEGEFIPRGTKIKVLKEKSGNLIVIAIEPITG